MKESSGEHGGPVIIEADQINDLIHALSHDNRQVIGPVVRDEAVVYEAVASAADLPKSIHDRQDAGACRLERTDDPRYFAVMPGPQGWKRYLYPPKQTLWQARRQDKGFELTGGDAAAAPAYAFLGVRACELAALAIHDRVFDNGDFADPGYQARRQAALIVAVNCTRAGGTCFCTSMATGPGVKHGFDLALTELADEDGHRFLVETGSAQGAAVLAGMDTRPAGDDDLATARDAIRQTARRMGRDMIAGAQRTLRDNPGHPRWDEVAARCLGCGNCTMVCPTCFCTSTKDLTSLDGETATRQRVWDSCFTLDFSYIHGGTIRRGAASRYRQWITHKLSWWHDQFGESGCTGCGRCITWCPVGIDITEEARALSG